MPSQAGPLAASTTSGNWPLMSCRSRLYRRTSRPPVELGADAVVLVLDPDRRPEARHDLGRVLRRRGEHELDGVASPRAPAVVPASCVTVVEIAAQPRPMARWSDSGNGRPERKTAAGRSSSFESWVRYRASNAVFSEVRVVPPTRSANSLQPRMAAMVYLRLVKPVRSVYLDPFWRTDARMPCRIALHGGFR
jgi:hypothetical protein